MPRDQTQLKSLLGFALFIQHSIPGYAIIAQPLNKLLEKKYQSAKAYQAECKRSTEYLEAFGNVKKACLDAVTLHSFDPKHPIIIGADGSGTAIGVVAGHYADLAEDYFMTAGTVYIICALYSRVFQGAELNYSQPEREVLALVYALLKLRAYLGLYFLILTDHKAWVQV